MPPPALASIAPVFRAPMVPLALAWGAGIAAGTTLAPPAPWLIAGAAGLLLVTAGALALRRDTSACALLLAFTVLLGALRAHELPPPPGDIAAAAIEGAVAVEARIVEEPRRWAPDRARLLLDVEAIVTETGAAAGLGPRARHPLWRGPAPGRGAAPRRGAAAAPPRRLPQPGRLRLSGPAPARGHRARGQRAGGPRPAAHRRRPALARAGEALGGGADRRRAARGLGRAPGGTAPRRARRPAARDRRCLPARRGLSRAGRLRLQRGARLGHGVRAPHRGRRLAPRDGGGGRGGAGGLRPGGGRAGVGDPRHPDGAHPPRRGLPGARVAAAERAGPGRARAPRLAAGRSPRCRLPALLRGHRGHRLSRGAGPGSAGTAAAARRASPPRWG